MKGYLGKDAAPILIAHDGELIPGTWLTRRAPDDVRQGGGATIKARECFALTYALVRTGDTITEATGERWSVINAEFTRAGAGDHRPLRPETWKD